MNKLVSAAGILATSALLAVSCSSEPDESSASSGAVSSGSVSSGAASSGAASSEAASSQPGSLPGLTVSTVMDGLNKPWDVVQAPDGAILTGERSGRFVVQRADGSTGDVAADLDDLYAQGETGLMGIALAQDFSTSRTLYTCQGVRGSGERSNEIAVMSWTADPNWTALTRTGEVLGGIPVADGGRHGGCRILAHPDGTLFIGTGDTASPTVPQDPASLGGKVLHVNVDGTPATGSSPVYTLGHRNVQGLAIQPGTGALYEVEQGTTRDDELNLLVAGGNYGYKPDRKPSTYDESVPMTDPDRVPGAIAAVWSSGSPTIATPDVTFVDGSAWGEWNGAAVISSQQGQKLVFLKLAADGKSYTDEAIALEGEYGRLRSLTSLPDGSFLLTTDNGTDDKVLRVTPA